MSTLTRVARSHAHLLVVSASTTCTSSLIIRPWTQVYIPGSYPLQLVRTKKTRGAETPKASKLKSSANAPTKDDPAFKGEVAKMEPKMVKIVSMFTSDVVLLESRVTGRALPSFVENLPVQGLGKDEARPLTEVATIGVRDGNTLLVTAFEEKMLRNIDKALRADGPYSSEPVNAMTLRVFVPKPTTELRKQLVKDAAKQAEQKRIAIRNVRQHGMQTLGVDKNSTEAKLIQTLTDEHITKIDEILKKFQKAANS